MQWEGQLAEEATWESLKRILAEFPNLEVKVAVEGEGSCYGAELQKLEANLISEEEDTDLGMDGERNRDKIETIEPNKPKLTYIRYKPVMDYRQMAKENQHMDGPELLTCPLKPNRWFKMKAKAYMASVQSAIKVKRHCSPWEPFVSHCGWNSILESLWYGVPIATWPIYAEQQMNAFEMVKELGLADEIKLDYRRGSDLVLVEQVERGVRQLMDGEWEVREKVKETRERSRGAVRENGSSNTFLGQLVEKLTAEI